MGIAAGVHLYVRCVMTISITELTFYNRRTSKPMGRTESETKSRRKSKRRPTPKTVLLRSATLIVSAKSQLQKSCSPRGTMLAAFSSAGSSAVRTWKRKDTRSWSGRHSSLGQRSFASIGCRKRWLKIDAERDRMSIVTPNEIEQKKV